MHKLLSVQGMLGQMGRWLLPASQMTAHDTTVRLWEVASEREIATFATKK